MAARPMAPAAARRAQATRATEFLARLRILLRAAERAAEGAGPALARARQRALLAADLSPDVTVRIVGENLLARSEALASDAALLAQVWTDRDADARAAASAEAADIVAALRAGVAALPPGAVGEYRAALCDLLALYIDYIAGA